eukprot:g29450.t1
MITTEPVTSPIQDLLLIHILLEGRLTHGVRRQLVPVVSGCVTALAPCEPRKHILMTGSVVPFNMFNILCVQRWQGLVRILAG